MHHRRSTLSSESRTHIIDMHQHREADGELALQSDGDAAAPPNRADDDDDDADGSQRHGESTLQWIVRFVRTTPSLFLLTAFYVVQGIPIGFVLGTLPFLLKRHLTYTQIGVFTMSSYPYSLKLLWSPIVDSLWVKSVGRRKTWIVPMQILSAFLFLWLAHSIDDLVSLDTPATLSLVYTFTACFFVVIFAAATQDIAVDGLGVTLLQGSKRAYASSGAVARRAALQAHRHFCVGAVQSVGMQMGIFVSYTLLLAFNSAEFANYFRSVPQTTGFVSLSDFMRGCGWSVLLFTLYVWFAFREPPCTEADGSLEIGEVYRRIVHVMRLRTVQRLAVVLLLVRVGHIVFDTVSMLKLIDKGEE